MNNAVPPFTKEFGYIKLARILKPGSRKLMEVLNTFGSIERISALTLKEWIESTILTPAELAGIKRINDSEIYEIIKYCKLNGIRIITPEDDEYPNNLRYIENPPTVLYARGERLDSTAPIIGIVGARKSTDFGNKAAYSLAAKLAMCGFTVISGGAVGVDSFAHKGAMNAGGKTIMVLGCGMDSDYLPVQQPLRIMAEQNGTVISEFEPKVPASRYTFPIRNRLISALSSGVAVIEAGLHSGALITATYAMEQGKEIFALPGRLDQVQYGGTNELLRDGAIPLLKVEDILEVYTGRFGDKLKLCGELTPEVKQGYSAEVARLGGKPARTAPKKANVIKPNDSERPAENTPPTKPAEFTNADQLPCGQNAKKVYSAFTQNIEFSDTLSNISGVTGGDFIAAVTELEIFGFIKAVPVGRYEKIK
ncbi:MAG: DNA-processing protein DprA [Clostridia bacterium]|nr:DNA-processing protein DprA [Clostridia bacterium]